MDELTDLEAIPVPPVLEKGIGYAGQRQWLAVLIRDDGQRLVCTNGARWVTSPCIDPWAEFLTHPRVRPHLTQLGRIRRELPVLRSAFGPT